MGTIAVSQRVIARNNFGRFTAALKEGATATVQEAIKEGEVAAAALAPKKTGALAGSIESHMTGATSGEWTANTKYAMAQEVGGAAHLQTGYVNFFWEREGRDWEPGKNMIRHPGNPATHYLLRSYQGVMARIMEIAKRNYPS